MNLGYARVSTLDQSLNRQIDQLTQAGCEQSLKEKITGTKKDRPELQRLLSLLRPDDVVIISDLTRLSRSTLYRYLGRRGEEGNCDKTGKKTP